MLGIGADVVDEEPVREQPAREDAVGVRGVAEVVRFVGPRARGRGRDHLAVARRLGVGVDHREEVGILLVGVAGPHVQHRLVLVGSQSPDEHGLVLRAATGRVCQERGRLSLKPGPSTTPTPGARARPLGSDDTGGAKGGGRTYRGGKVASTPKAARRGRGDPRAEAPARPNATNIRLRRPSPRTYYHPSSEASPPI